jgi:hypothetical protein
MKRLSTRTIKAVTTLMVLFAFLLMFAGPWVIRRPKTMKARAFANRLAVYSGALGVCSVTALLGAYAIMRREQDAYRERAMENMRELIEATRQDRIAKIAEQKGEEADS